MIRKAIFSLLMTCAVSSAFGQAKTTASRYMDVQIGGGLVSGDSDYRRQRFRGYMGYVDFDLTSHWGVEGIYRQINQPDKPTPEGIYLRTYQVGARYHRDYLNNRLAPYVKGLYGRGVFNFPGSLANLAYNMGTGGAGLDIRVNRFLNVRAIDYEYQHWFAGPALPNGLNPTTLSVGVAYHFSSDRTPRR